jgi:hypothetical protein
MVDTCRMHDMMRNAYTVLVEILQSNRPLASLGHKWNFNFKMNFRGIWIKIVDYIQLAQNWYQWRDVS